MIATPLYAGILTLIFVVLSVRVIRARYTAKVRLGDGGDRRLLRAQRVQANFAEYVPLALILMTLIELQRGISWVVHVVGLLLLVGRLAHAYGFGGDPGVFRLRQAGMTLTFAALIAGAAANLWLALAKYTMAP